MISILLGVPGAGKTTELTKIARKGMKQGKTVFSNCYIEGCNILNAREDLGKYLIENSVIIIDEGGTEFDNRGWKNFNRRLTRWFKLHRHYKCDVYLSSQDYDIDKKIRDLAVEIWVIRKSLIPYCLSKKLIKSKIDIDENKKIGQKGQNIIKTFRYMPWILGGKKYTFGPRWWKYFDSYYQDNLMKKEWKTWTEKDAEYYTYDFTKPEVLKEFEK